MNSLECKYCKYYEYDSELTKTYWQLTQADDREVPVIGRCTFGNKSIGNAVLSGGYHSDGKQGCNAFEHRGISDELKYHKYDTFIRDGKCVCWISQIQYEYSPYLFRIKTEGGGGWSASEEDLDNPDKYKLIWRETDESV